MAILCDDVHEGYEVVQVIVKELLVGASREVDERGSEVVNAPDLEDAFGSELSDAESSCERAARAEVRGLTSLRLGHAAGGRLFQGEALDLEVRFLSG